MKQIHYKNGAPMYENTETEVEVKNIFDKDDEAMFAHLLKKTMGLTDDEELPDGMKETPHRLCKYWTEAFASGYMNDPKRHLKKLFDVERGNEVDAGLKPSSYFDTGIVICKFNSSLSLCANKLKLNVLWSFCLNELTHEIEKHLRLHRIQVVVARGPREARPSFIWQL